LTHLAQRNQYRAPSTAQSVPRTQHSAISTAHPAQRNQYSAPSTAQSVQRTQHSAPSTAQSVQRNHHSAPSTAQSSQRTQHSAIITAHPAQRNQYSDQPTRWKSDFQKVQQALFRNVQTASGVHLDSSSVGRGVSFSGDKAPGARI